MPIDLPDTAGGTRLPVLKRRRIGETFVGALVKKPEPRPILRDGEPVLKDNGKPRQELVVTLLTMPGSDMAAGIGDEVGVPEPGEVVRTILRGKAFGAWIDADSALRGRRVGDVVTLTSDFGQKYDAAGRPSGEPLTTQEQVDAVPRGVTLGVYGSLSIRRATPEDGPWVTKAEEAYYADQQSQAIALEDDDEDGAPF